MAAGLKSLKRWVTDMSDIYILNLFADLRNQMLNMLSRSTGQLNYIPKGFRNNLHWQMGHVLTITDELIFGLSGADTRLPLGYGKYFTTGTSPSNWLEQPPEAEDIMNKLKEQQLEIAELYEGKLEQPLMDKNNFLQASVIGELFHVLIAHESMHLGMIRAMTNVIEND
ncbi:DinB family protein [Paenibacillus septentrionalis]|uniref:DinB family protein n=1 Tax=Paenibacillus septentrionalis TaxID=429342 RepID=A0ABW1V3G7_9BACL